MTKKSVKKTFKLISRYKKEMFLSLFATLMISLVGVVDSLILSYMIDNVLYSSAKHTLLTIAIIMLLITVFQITLRGLKSLLIQKISYEMDIDLKKTFYSKILTIKYSFFEKHKMGELTSRINDTRMVRNALSEGLISILANLIMFLVVGIALFTIDRILFTILFVSILILSVISLVFARFFAREYPQSMEKNAELQSFITETFSGIESVKTYPSYETFERKYDEKQNENITSGWNIGEKRILHFTYCSLVEKLSAVLILVFGCFFVMKDKMSLGQVASFISLSSFFSNSVALLLELQSGIQEAVAAIDRLFEIFDEETENDGNLDKISVLNDTPNLLFEDVSFSYSNENELYKNFSLTIKSGEWISLVGKTGCGKTTFTKLLLKLWKIQEGKILWNGMDIQKIDTSIIRQRIAYIPQEIVMFSGTIVDNITMFDEAIPEEDVISITKKVGIYEKIDSLEKGFKTTIGERGFSLSGGEKQKIAICRALIKNPLVLILDEATSNLDSTSEKSIIKIIESLRSEGKTIISIAHRLSTVKNCDRIYVMENGKIVENGTFNDLEKRNGFFTKMIYNSQT